jgi:hypothetical protein
MSQSLSRPVYLKRSLARFLREVNPLGWPIGTAIVARDAARRVCRMPKTAHSYSKVGAPTGLVLDAVMQWLGRAQDATRSGGVAAYYTLYGRYGPAYPETTGYIIPTFLAYARHSERGNYVERAAAAANWIASLQLPNGAFPGGFAGATDGPSVFNTGQIIFGLVAAGQQIDPGYLERAVAAGRWLANVQSEDGVWSDFTYEGRPHVYYTMVAWALAELHRATNEPSFAVAARRNLASAIRLQQPNGFFEGFHLGRRPIYLHFIAYTLQGLVEGGRLLEMPEAVEAARRPAERLLRRFEIHKTLPGALTADWKSDARYECLTGNAQLAHVWVRLWEETGDLRFLNAAVKMNELVKSKIARRGASGVRGGVKGSDPVWGKYLFLRYPNWAAKFTADALLLELESLASLEAQVALCES